MHCEHVGWGDTHAAGRRARLSGRMGRPTGLRRVGMTATGRGTAFLYFTNIHSLPRIMQALCRVQGQKAKKVAE